MILSMRNPSTAAGQGRNRIDSIPKGRSGTSSAIIRDRDIGVVGDRQLPQVDSSAFVQPFAWILASPDAPCFSTRRRITPSPSSAGLRAAISITAAPSIDPDRPDLPAPRPMPLRAQPSNHQRFRERFRLRVDPRITRGSTVTVVRHQRIPEPVNAIASGIGKFGAKAD